MQQMTREKLFYTLNLGQATMGTLVPLLLLGALQVLRKRIPDLIRRRMYFASAVLILIGSVRHALERSHWRSTVFQEFARGHELQNGIHRHGRLAHGGHFDALPFVILTVFVKLFLSERLPTSGHVPHATDDAGPDSSSWRRPGTFERRAPRCYRIRQRR